MPIDLNLVEQNRMEWNGIEWNGMEQNGMEWNRIEQKTLLMCRSRIAWAKPHTNFRNGFWGKVL